MEPNYKYNDKKIAVLLSTYNGEKYLPSLLDSLLNQTSGDYHIYIRDDGSKDSTKGIIDAYDKISDKITVVKSVTNLGSKYSFLELLKLVNSDYYMFCDQDDVWLPIKVEHTYTRMLECEKLYPGKPMIVHTDLRLVDGDLNLTAESYWRYKQINTDLPHSFNFLCHYNDVTGCVMMLNNKAKEASRSIFDIELPKHIYHDAIISIMAVKAGGKVMTLDEPTILYRRHGGNETDATTKHDSSILHLSQWRDSIKTQKERYCFFKELGYGSFLKFMLYRFLYVIIRTAKKR